jgi:hypothetical protein
MKKTAYLLAVVILLCAVPAIAQGPFTDVPTDHWAYQAVNDLQKDGIIIGYPDGTFAGKRTITRYEFAVAIARMLPLIKGTVVNNNNGTAAPDLSGYALKTDIPAAVDLSGYATKADLDAIRKLVDEFRDELAQMGVDVDTLKKEVAALDSRVTAVEIEQRRVKISGDVNIFADATDHRSGNIPAVDLDSRTIPFTDTLGRSVGVVEDFDLNIVGRVSSTTTANATIDYGNYLNYIGFVDDYVGGVRPRSKTSVTGQPNGLSSEGTLTQGGSMTDGFFPYYLYIDTACGKGDITVGRFPLQFTPYTLKMIDVDSYSTNLKTDSGNYPVDGAKVALAFGGVNLTLFAVKNDENAYLANGLTGQPNDIIGAINKIGGNSVGGLLGPIDQTAGARITWGGPGKLQIGGTFYQAWSSTSAAMTNPYTDAPDGHDQARVFGGDITVPFMNRLSFTGSWTRSDALQAAGYAVGDMTDDNQAIDGKINARIGKLALGVGYKDIGINFAAAGAWDKIGDWTNPTDIKGPYADISYPLMHRVKLVLDGEYVELKQSPNDNGHDKIAKAEGGINWGFSKGNSVDLGYQWIKYNPDSSATEGTATYLSLGWAHQLGPNTGVKIGYQFINWSAGSDGSFYGSEDFRAGEGTVQIGVSF